MLITSQTMSEEWACLVSLRSSAEALTTRPANEVSDDALCVVFLFACMYVCVCVSL